MMAPQQLPLTLPLRESSTLQSFVVGRNEALLAALAALPGQAGQLYLWGEPGNGRSHLLEALVRQVLSSGDGACLLSGDELLRTHPAVLEGLESMSLVAIDDVNQLAGNSAWEEALFHLYNRVRAEHGAMLFSASLPPSQSGFGLPDLASRLAAGPVFQLHPLDDAGRQQLLVSRAAARGLAMTEEVAGYLLVRSARDPAALLAQLELLDRQALVHQHRLTVPFVKKVLGW